MKKFNLYEINHPTIFVWFCYGVIEGSWELLPIWMQKLIEKKYESLIEKKRESLKNNRPYNGEI